MYPYWASDEDIKEARYEGIELHENRPVDWQECPQPEANCESHQYWDQLACECFSVDKCEEKTCPLGGVSVKDAINSHGSCCGLITWKSKLVQKDSRDTEKRRRGEIWGKNVIMKIWEWVPDVKREGWQQVLQSRWLFLF